MEPEVFELREKLNKPAEEAYKVLRTNIQFFDSGKSIKTIAVTSYKPGEGKTTTSINLALSMAKAGLNVLYVDADLRKPMIMKKN
jgi:Mrp family chromosome partitioning ATPase